MGYFKRKTSWTVLEFGSIKMCLVSGGIAFGIWLCRWLHPYAAWFFFSYLVTGLIFLVLWLTNCARANNA